MVGEAGDGALTVTARRSGCGRESSSWTCDADHERDRGRPGGSAGSSRARAGARVLIMTTFDVDGYVFGALRAGASGFLLKDSRPEELVAAIRLSPPGTAVIAPAMTRRLLDLRGRTMTPVPSAAGIPALARIAAREMTVLKLAARGLTNGEIAVKMDLAPSSVKTHVGHLLAKLGFTDRVQLVVFAYEHELVRPGSRETAVDGGGVGAAAPGALTAAYGGRLGGTRGGRS